LSDKEISDQWKNLDVAFPTCDKVKSKNRPTFLLRQNNLVNKVDPETVLSGSLGKLRGNQLIWNPRALAEALSKGNTSMHDMVIVYCRGKGNLTEAE
jgi:hypothetical protein